MAFDVFLWFEKGNAPEVKGETNDDHFKKMNATELQSVSFATDNAPSIGSHSGGAGSGKAKFEEVTVTMPLNQSAAALYLACCSGAHYPKAFIGFRKAGASPKGSGQPYCTVTLALVFVSRFEILGNPSEDLPTVKVQLAFGAAEVKYQVQQADGSLGPPVATQWSVVKNNSTLNI